MQVKKRKEIEEKYKWDLTTIYKTDEDFYKDVEEINNILNKMEKFTGKIFESLDNLKKYLEYDEEISLKLNKVVTYGARKNDEDISNTKYQAMYQSVETICSKVGTIGSSFRPELLATDEDKINEYLKDETIKKYKLAFDELLRYKDHTLSDQEEALLSKLSLAFDSNENTFSMLDNVDIKFPNITDEDGNEVELTNSNYIKYASSKNRNTREQAFKRMHETFGKYKNTIASTFLGHVNTNIALSKIKKYNSTIEKCLFNDNVDVSVYENLINSVKSRKDVINNYYGLMQEELELDELHRYDTYAEFGCTSDKEYTLDEAKELIYKSLEVLGDDYKNKLDRAFNERWIDYFPSEGKRGGAYSSGGYGTNAFILTNFEGKYNDVSTLIHELGHSMHTTYSCEKQDMIYSNYKIFVAEVASTTNELLLAKYMLKNSTSKEEKLAILQKLMILYSSTMLRQTMFGEFEKEIYAKRENDEPVTHEILEETYYNLCKSYFGENVILDDCLKYEWSRIPHFYYNFYVYKYATSLAASTYIADHILNEEGFKDKYIKFLSSGSSMYPLDELKLVDVDLTNKEVIEEAMNEFNSYIEEYRRIKNS